MLNNKYYNLGKQKARDKVHLVLFVCRRRMLERYRDKVQSSNEIIGVIYKNHVTVIIMIVIFTASLHPRLSLSLCVLKVLKVHPAQQFL